MPFDISNCVVPYKVRESTEKTLSGKSQFSHGLELSVYHKDKDIISST